MGWMCWEGVVSLLLWNGKVDAFFKVGSAEPGVIMVREDAVVDGGR